MTLTALCDFQISLTSLRISAKWKYHQQFQKLYNFILASEKYIIMKWWHWPRFVSQWWSALTIRCYKKYIFLVRLMIFSFLWSEQQLFVNRSMWFSRVDSLRPDYYVDFENGSVDSQLLTSWIFLALKSENTVVEI